mmetsp:Transcript_17371/g.47350  ORF Transcript_17371/g.47350 Transcript_17371/m.47350 type:complete len:221 (-) Transcript_17371:32-694(-)
MIGDEGARLGIPRRNLVQCLRQDVTLCIHSLGGELVQCGGPPFRELPLESDLDLNGSSTPSCIHLRPRRCGLRDHSCLCSETLHTAAQSRAILRQLFRNGGPQLSRRALKNGARGACVVNDCGDEAGVHPHMLAHLHVSLAPSTQAIVRAIDQVLPHECSAMTARVSALRRIPLASSVVGQANIGRFGLLLRIIAVRPLQNAALPIDIISITSCKVVPER